MHIDPDDLALLAIGEEDAAARAHVGTCEQCSRELASLVAVSDLLVLAGPRATGAAPSHLWAGIEAAVRAEPQAGGHPTDELGARRDAPRSSAARSRRGLPLPVSLLSAAAAGAVVALAGSAVLGDTDPEPAVDVVVASAELEALSDTVVPASAEVVERGGQRVLQVRADGIPSVEDGYLEVWLLSPDASGMVTVGLLESGVQEFVLPASLSTQSFPVVDVSLEHFDGDPTHSGESLWRGPLAGT